MRLTTRRRHIVSGLVAMVLVAGVTTIGVQWSFGAFDDGYRLRADFAAAGQGLVEGSDVKVRGVDIGHVESIELRDGRALVTMFIDDGHDIPSRSSTFTIRPKTLFGEKFVDVTPGPDEAGGPYFADGDEVPRFFVEGDPMPVDVLRDAEGRALRSAGGFELEQVLMDVYPILQALDPNEVSTILDELSTAGRDLGPTLNRLIVNSEQVLGVQAARDAELRRFVDDLALLVGEVETRTDDFVAGANAYNDALPVLIENEDALSGLLQELQSTSGEIADLLRSNAEFVDSVYSDGQAVLDTLYDHRSQVVPLVVGIRQYLETIGGAARIPIGDGTVMAAVKGYLGGLACGVVPCAPGTPEAPNPGPVPLPPLPPLPLPPLPLPPLQLPELPTVDDVLGGLTGEFRGEGSSGTQGVLDILLRPLAGGG